MKKTTIAFALVLSLIIPTTTYGFSDTWWYQEVEKAAAESLERDKAARAAFDPQTTPGGLESPWIEAGYAHKVQNYSGRIEGTWQKREDGYYYVQTDGTDLKNGYIDGFYCAWTGKMMPEFNNIDNWLVHNSLYGGQVSPYAIIPNGFFLGQRANVNLSGTGLRTCEADLAAYKRGERTEYDYVKEALDWMDSEMPRLLQLSENDRAKEIAKLVATRVATRRLGSYEGEAFHTGGGLPATVTRIFQIFAARAGLTVADVENGRSKYKTSTSNTYWCIVIIDGVDYLVDIPAFQLTGDTVYLQSTTLWDGYLTYEEAKAVEEEEDRIRRAELEAYLKEHPTPEGGIPVNGLDESQKGGAF